MPPKQAADDKISPADRLSHRWKIFRSETNTLYDTLLWQPLDWPFLTLQWQPAAWKPPEHILDLQTAAAAAAERAALGLASDDDAAEPSHSATATAADGMGIDQPPPPAAAAAEAIAGSSSSGDESDPDVLAMPFEYQYIVTGEQTTGQEASRLIVWRVSLLGQVPDGFDANRHRLALTRGEIEPVMVIPYGQQDVNRLHIMPQDTNLLAACSDDPAVHIYDLRLNQPSHQQQQQQQQQQRSGSISLPARSSSPGSPDHLEEADKHPAAAAAAAAGDGSSSDRPPELAAVLGGRSAGGFGLEWNPVHQGLLLGGDVEGCVQLWDVGRDSSSSGSSSKGVAVIEPVQVVNGFTGCAINDVSWHSSGTTFAAATESGQLLLQDIRAGPAAAILGQGFGSNLRSGQLHVRRSRGKKDTSDAAEVQDCLSVDFDPNHGYRLATGGRDGYVYVSDMRRLDSPLERLPLHAGDVRHVSWSAGAPGILASAGEDSHVLLWDANKMKNAVKQQQKRQQRLQQQQQQQQAGSSIAAAAPSRRLVNELSEAIQQLTVPGLLFLHHGHMSSVEQVAWNPDRPWMLASVSGSAWAADGAGADVEVQESVLMVWEVNRSAGLLDTM